MTELLLLLIDALLMPLAANVDVLKMHTPLAANQKCASQDGRGPDEGACDGQDRIAAQCNAFMHGHTDEPHPQSVCSCTSRRGGKARACRPDVAFRLAMTLASLASAC